MATQRERLEELRRRERLQFLRGLEQQQAQQVQQRGIQAAPSPTREELLAQINQDIGPLESFAIAAGRGLTDIGRAIGLAEPEPEVVQQAFTGLEEQRPISQTVGRVVGQSAPFLPAGIAAGGIASIPARIAAGATVGGIEGAAIERGTGGQDIAQAAGVGGLIAGGAEALFPVLSRLGGALVQRVTGRAPEGALFDAAGQPSPQLQSALESSGLTVDDLGEQAQQFLTQQPARVDPEQAVRAAQFEQVGITPTRAQITREAADFQAQQEAAKTSGRVRGALEQQEGLLVNRFDEAVAGTGGQPVTSGSPVIDKVVNISTQLDNQISDLYQAARAAAPDAKNVRMNKLSSVLRANAPSNNITGGLISAIRGELQQRGILDEGFKVTGRVSVDTAEEVRKVMNTFFNSTTDFGRQKLREFKDALDDDVFRAAGQDVFNEARTAKADFERRLSRAKVSKFDSRKANLVRDVLENKVDPDQFIPQVVTSKKWRAPDLEQLKQFSTDGGADPAPWNDLRAETMDFIKESAFKGPIDQAGNQALSRAGLDSAINKIGTEKLKVIFEPDELRFLRDIKSVAALREPVRGTALGRGPSAQAIGRVETAIKENPLLAVLVEAVTIDRSGRAVVKSRPDRIAKQRSTLQRVVPGAVAAPTIAAQQEQNNDT